MNPDTLRTLNDIKRNGWYRLSTGMGEGGWSEVSKIGKFKTYALYAIQDGYLNEIESIKALDDKTAHTAFSKLFHLEMFDYWEILQRIVELRLVKSGGD